VPLAEPEDFAADKTRHLYYDTLSSIISDAAGARCHDNRLLPRLTFHISTNDQQQKLYLSSLAWKCFTDKASSILTVITYIQGGPIKTCHFTFVYIFANY